ncbi:MAG: hypothetical protein MMC33_002247 [Icmadophila ericetorum]|nr:hypothetical protein [Icmadophila ericetorum]
MTNAFLEELLKHVSGDDVERLVVGVLCIPDQLEDGILNFPLLAERTGFKSAGAARDKYFQSKDRIQRAFEKMFGEAPPLPPPEDDDFFEEMPALYGDELFGEEMPPLEGEEQFGSGPPRTSGDFSDHFGLDGEDTRMAEPANDNGDLYTASPPRVQAPTAPTAPPASGSAGRPALRETRSRQAKGMGKAILVDMGSEDTYDDDKEFVASVGGEVSDVVSENEDDNASDSDGNSDNEPSSTPSPEHTARSSRPRAGTVTNAKPRAPPRKRAPAKPKTPRKPKVDEGSKPVPSKPRAPRKKPVAKSGEPMPPRSGGSRAKKANAQTDSTEPKAKTKGKLVLEAIETDEDEYLDPKLPEARRLMAGPFDTSTRLGGMKKNPRPRTPSAEWDPLEFGDPWKERREAREKEVKAEIDKATAKAKRATAALEKKRAAGGVTDEGYAQAAQEIQARADAEIAEARGDDEQAVEERNGQDWDEEMGGVGM